LRLGYRPLFGVGFFARLCSAKSIDFGQGAGDPLAQLLLRPNFGFARFGHLRIPRSDALTRCASFDLNPMRKSGQQFQSLCLV
jgi:hypothetical protein